MYFKSVNRGLKVTTLGWQLIILTLGVGFFGISTGINGMFIFLGISLGLFIISGLISEKNIKEIKISLENKEYFFNEKVANRFHIFTENKNKNDLYSISIKIINFNYSKNSSNFIVGEKKIRILEGNRKRKVPIYLSKLTRGFYKTLHIETETTFPFGIFLKYKVDKVATKFYILPCIIPELEKKWKKLIASWFTYLDGQSDFLNHEKYNFLTPLNKIDWKKNSNLPFDLWVSKKYTSDKKEKNILIKVDKNLFYFNEYQFELTLRNIITGFYVLEKMNYKIIIDLGKYGFFNEKKEIMKTLSTIKRTDNKSEITINKHSEKLNKKYTLSVLVSKDKVIFQNEYFN
ncbi:MAG: hypothetical protein CMP11_01105 [Zetaproteobacteria bacterium]|nr:hypothetical protein [Pseudobdellovibrionaceae bacterium]|tara:strand:- start:1030 stop:2067 length:1038 start_codon:yes stop_codon:yes gene_type:complete